MEASVCAEPFLGGPEPMASSLSVSLNSEGLVCHVSLCVGLCEGLTRARPSQLTPLTTSFLSSARSQRGPPILQPPGLSLPAPCRLCPQHWPATRASHSPPNFNCETPSLPGRTHRHGASPCQTLPPDPGSACCPSPIQPPAPAGKSVTACSRGKPAS